MYVYACLSECMNTYTTKSLAIGMRTTKYTLNLVNITAHTLASHLVKPGIGESVENVLTDGHVTCRSFTVDLIKCAGRDNPSKT